MRAPVFILSLPRSGSTLLQRLLVRHPQIASASEPWLMLPIAYMRGGPGESLQSAPYDHDLAQKAIDDLISCFPDKDEDWFRCVHDFAISVYSRLCGPETVYFVDKTPRYYQILPFIERIFPDAKFIFLFRQPLAVMASIVRTWNRGHFVPDYQNRVDLEEGPRLLAEGWRRLSDRSIRITYENLVEDTPGTMMHIMHYLALSGEAVDWSSVNGGALTGRMGDKVGVRRYSGVVRERLAEWARIFDTRFRRYYARRYIQRLGSDLVRELGYDSQVLIEQMDRQNLRGIGFTDLLDVMRVSMYLSLTGNTSRRILRKILVPGCLRYRASQAHPKRD